MPFMWNGVNYLLKMGSDLDFLDGHKPLRSWLGFSLYRNPFVVPLPLEQLPPSSGPPPPTRANVSSPTGVRSNQVGGGQADSGSGANQACLTA